MLPSFRSRRENMRHALAIAGGLFLSVTGLAGAQDAARTEQLEALKSARTELESLRSELRTLKEECAGETTKQCESLTSTGRQVIIRRYRWVPASSLGLNTQLAVSGLATSGLTASGFVNSGLAGLQTPVVTSQSQFAVAQSPFVGVQNAPLVTSGFATQGFTTGLSSGFATSSGFSTGAVGVRSFAPASSSVLPSSPNSRHQSYEVYSQGAFTQSLRANGAGIGVLGASLANTPVYPTTQFRGTSGFVNTVPAPYYSVY